MSDEMTDFDAWAVELDEPAEELSAWEVACEATRRPTWWVDESMPRIYVPDDGDVRIVTASVVVEPATGSDDVAGVRVVTDKGETLFIYRQVGRGRCTLNGWFVTSGQLRLEVFGRRIASSEDIALQVLALPTRH